MTLELARSLLSQAGAIPWRRRGSALEVLLITSRSSGRWLFPKGNIDPGALARETALQEAWEEAGVAGDLAPRAIGSYSAFKTLPAGGVQPTIVEMYPLQVATCEDDWPERGERERRWTPAPEATDLVTEQGLKILLIQMRARLGRGRAR